MPQTEVVENITINNNTNNVNCFLDLSRLSVICARIENYFRRNDEILMKTKFYSTNAVSILRLSSCGRCILGSNLLVAAFILLVISV